MSSESSFIGLLWEHQYPAKSRRVWDSQNMFWEPILEQGKPRLGPAWKQFSIIPEVVWEHIPKILGCWYYYVLGRERFLERLETHTLAMGNIIQLVHPAPHRSCLGHTNNSTVILQRSTIQGGHCSMCHQHPSSDARICASLTSILGAPEATKARPTLCKLHCLSDSRRRHWPQETSSNSYTFPVRVCATHFSPLLDCSWAALGHFKWQC